MMTNNQILNQTEEDNPCVELEITPDYKISNKEYFETLLKKNTKEQPDIVEIVNRIAENIEQYVIPFTYEMFLTNSSYHADFAAIDLGLVNKENKELYLLTLCKFDDVYEGTRVMTTEQIRNHLVQRSPKKEKVIRKNYPAFTQRAYSLIDKRKKDGSEEEEYNDNIYRIGTDLMAPEDCEEHEENAVIDENFEAIIKEAPEPEDKWEYEDFCSEEPTRFFNEEEFAYIQDTYLDDLDEDFELSDEDYDLINQFREKKLNAVTLKIQERLLINPWEANFAGLRTYLRIIGFQACNMLVHKKTKYYMRCNNTVVIDSGLFDKYNQHILIAYDWNTKLKKFEVRSIVESKNDLIKLGFVKEQLEKTIHPINLSEDNEFCTDISMYDFNYGDLTHIIDARRKRFPNLYRYEPASSLAEKIIAELKLGINIARIDPSYVKSVYYGGKWSKQLSYLLPLHLSQRKSETPYLCLVIAKDFRTGYYRIKTIEYYNDELKNLILCTNPYSKVW